MNLTVTVDTSILKERFAQIRTDQIPFAMANALNDSAKQFQAKQRAHDLSVFTERRPTWMDQSVKITHFATKIEQWATIAIQPPGSSADRADIIDKFEDQTIKKPYRGHSVAVPTAFIKRRKTDIIPMNLFPSHLNLHASGGRVIGDQRTFLVHLANGRSIILQRAGRGARSITAAIWIFKPDVRITPDLDFEKNAVEVFSTEWASNLTTAFAQAMSTAR